MSDREPKFGFVDGGKWFCETAIAVVTEKDNRMPFFGLLLVVLGLLIPVLRWAGFPIGEITSSTVEDWVPFVALTYAVFHIFMLTPYKRTRILEHRLAYLKEKRFEIECGESTTKRDAVIHIQITQFNPPMIGHTSRPIAFFGFRLINRGAMPSINCRATLIRIQDKNGYSICQNVAALPFEAKNQGDDLDVVTIHQNVPQPISVCSIFNDNNEVAAGSGNMKWRHDSIHELFKSYDPYDFIVAIADETETGEKETQIEVFRFHWKGNAKDSAIEHMDYKSKKL